MQTQTTLFSKQSNGRRARADTNENLQANLVRAAKAVKREDVMRDDLTFHVLRITQVANSANIAAETFSQVQITLFSKGLTMHKPVIEIDEGARRVVWRVGRSQPFQPLHTPWGRLWRGEESSQGVEAWVDANAAFELVMEGDTITLFESISPGRHRYLLTVLDSTDVAG